MPITTPTVAQGYAQSAAVAAPVGAQTANTTLVQDQLDSVLNKGGALMQTAANAGNQASGFARPAKFEHGYSSMPSRR